jgi:putative nucleotidyltransferase with HDIG domain
MEAPAAVMPLHLVCEMSRTLPCAPFLLPKLMVQLAKPTTTAQEIEAIIRLDSGLGSETLRLANSAYFSTSASCETITEALVRLGFREVYRLAVTKIASRWLSNPVQGYGWEPGDLYRHSLCVAVAADLLAKDTGRVDPETAYTAGLLHDVGKLALAYVCSEHFEQIRKLQADLGCSWRQAERRILGYDHTDVGGTLLSAWAFPQNLVQVVCYYDRPREAAHDHRDLVGIIHASKHLALALGAGVGEEGFRTELDEVYLSEAGFDNAKLEGMLPAVLEGARKLLGDGGE